MIKISSASRPIAFSLVLLFVYVEPAYAYIDPGTVSILLQILAAIGASILFLLGSLNTKIRSFLNNWRKKKTNPNAEK